MSDDKKFREEQLQKVRNLKQVGPAPKVNKPKFIPKMAVQRKAGRGR
jgi:hypothetical protein